MLTRSQSKRMGADVMMKETVKSRVHDTQSSSSKVPHFLKSLICIPHFASSKKETRFIVRGGDENFVLSIPEDPSSEKTKNSENTNDNVTSCPTRPDRDSRPLSLPPPPYSQDVNENGTFHLEHRRQGRVIVPSEISPTTNANAFVQVCPHEKLDLARLYRLATLPFFPTNSQKIDALTPSTSHHHRGHDKVTKQCQDSCKPLCVVSNPGFVAKFKGFGTYTYKSSAPPFPPRLVLSFHWEFKCLPADEVAYSTPAELQQFLLKTGIKLCPHKRISDMDIVNAVHPIINPDGVPADPIDRYLAQEVAKNCEVCGTRIKVYERASEAAGRTCRVDTIRLVGVGEGEVVSGTDVWEVEEGVEEVSRE